MRDLSKRQKETLEAINQYINKHNYPPAFRDLADMLGLKSSSTVSDLLHKLRDKGYISWEPTQPRTLRILKTAS
ncbi:transcriptional regulator [Sporosarcina globispora]|uniref:Transcriptional regulator n=1 Tax=Sporosarcina globispora TaxID=1459 RepID=A0A0M0GGK1_SPOGL|nr:transcriptional regulator [Sporosarcina globispora]KON88913.1 transcriptional regulator [Sporosarcina globispora]